jgi:serine/threonine protein kinase
VYSLGCTLYYAVTGKVPFPGGTTAEKIRRHLGETPLNPLHFNPDLPEAFCDAIAAMMQKDPDKRTPTAAAVVELLAPWRDDDAAKHLAELRPSGAANKAPAGKAAIPSAPSGLDETASFVLDDGEIPPSPVDSPSQVSQGTVPLAGELDDTLSGVHSPHRSGRRSRRKPAERTRSQSWRKTALAAGLAAAAAAALAAARFAALL